MRFKEWMNNGEVILDLKPGEILEHSQSKPTEEGYEAQHVSWEACERGVTRTWASWGRDCDGDSGCKVVHFCPWSKIKARTARAYVGDTCEEWQEVDWKGNVSTVKMWKPQWVDDPGWPEWEECEPYQYYDQHAEAMGY